MVFSPTLVGVFSSHCNWRNPQSALMRRCGSVMAHQRLGGYGVQLWFVFPTPLDVFPKRRKIVFGEGLYLRTSYITSAPVARPGISVGFY
jgi:hypothetical protein